MKNKRLLYILKYALYIVLLLLLYILQTVPGLFVVFGTTPPIWIIPAAVSIAMLEGEFIGGIFGALAGLLCDMGGYTYFGFNGFFLSLCCIGIGLLIIYLMRCNLLGCILFVFFTALSRGSLEFLFVYGMWGFENVWKIYLSKTLPVILFTTLTTPVSFYLFRGLHRRFLHVLQN